MKDIKKMDQGGLERNVKQTFSSDNAPFVREL